MSDLSRSLSGMAFAAIFSVSIAAPGMQARAVTGGPAPVAQPATAPAPVEFDVVSIKPNSSESGMVRIMNKPGVFSATGVTLKMLIQQAYKIRQDLISGGPGWVGSSAFDIEGKIAPADADALKAMSNEQRDVAMRQMLLHALADRFKLKAHIESKTLPVYELVLAKGGAKLKDTDPSNPIFAAMKGPDGAPAKPGMMRMSPGRLDAQGIDINSLTNVLSQRLEHTVIDKTGLTGKYDITLTYKPDDDARRDNGAADNSAPDLFTAIQEQLGLKLVPSKGSVDTLVIDSVEKPVEN